MSDLKLRCKAILSISNSFFYNSEYERASKTSDTVIQLLGGTSEDTESIKSTKAERNDILCKALMINGLCKWLNNIPTQSEQSQSLSKKIEHLVEAEEILEEGLSILQDGSLTESSADFTQFKDRLKQVKSTKHKAIELYSKSLKYRQNESESVKRSSVSHASTDKSNFRIRSVIQGKKAPLPKSKELSPPKDKFIYKRKPESSHSRGGRKAVVSRGSRLEESPVAEDIKGMAPLFIKSNFQGMHRGKKRAASQHSEAHSEKIGKRTRQEEGTGKKSKKTGSIRQEGGPEDYDSEIDQRSSPQTQKSIQNQSQYGNYETSGVREVNAEQGLEEDVSSSEEYPEEYQEEGSEGIEEKEQGKEEKEIEELNEKIKKLTKIKDELEIANSISLQSEILKALNTLIQARDNQTDANNHSYSASQIVPVRPPHSVSPYPDQSSYHNFLNQPSAIMGYNSPPSPMNMSNLQGMSNTFLHTSNINMSHIQPQNSDRYHQMAHMDPSNLLQVPSRRSVLHQNRQSTTATARSFTKAKMGETELDHTAEGYHATEAGNQSNTIPTATYRPEGYDMSRYMRADNTTLNNHQAKVQSNTDVYSTAQYVPANSTMIAWNKKDTIEETSGFDGSPCQELEDGSDRDLDKYIVPETHQMTLRNYRLKTERSRNTMGKSIYLCDFDLDMDRIITDFRKLIKNNAHSFSKNVIIDNLFYVIKLQIVCQKNHFEAIMCPMLSNTSDQDPTLCDDISFKREHLQKEQFVEMLNQVI